MRGVRSQSNVKYDARMLNSLAMKMMGHENKIDDYLTHTAPRSTALYLQLSAVQVPRVFRRRYTEIVSCEHHPLSRIKLETLQHYYSNKSLSTRWVPFNSVRIRFKLCKLRSVNPFHWYNLLSLEEGDIKESAVVVDKLKQIYFEREVIVVVSLCAMILHVGQLARYYPVYLSGTKWI